MIKPPYSKVWLLLLMLALGIRPIYGQTPLPQVTIVADGLVNPVGLTMLPNGNLLIAEEGTGLGDTSAGVSVMLADGTLGRLMSDISSTRDSGDLSGVALVSVSPDGQTIYAGNFAQGYLWTLPTINAQTIPGSPFTPKDFGTALERLNNVTLINPFDMTYDADGVPVVSDASGNGVAKANPDGTVRFIHRFDPLPDPTNPRLTVDAVPTGITRVGDEYYVTLFGG